MSSAPLIHMPQIDIKPVASNSAEKVYQSQGDGICTLCCPNPLACFMGCLGFGCLGCTTVQEQEQGVFLSFGKYLTTLTSPGCYCFNFCGAEIRKISTSTSTTHIEKVKVADFHGNPLIVSAVVTYKVVDANRAALDVPSYSEFVKTQSLGVLKKVVSMYPYEARAGEHSLKAESDYVRSVMTQFLQERVNCAGVSVLSFELSDLSYAPEVAQQMLVRQQAEATLAARQTIVRGAVTIAHGAILELDQLGVQLNRDEKAKLTSNLLITLCGEARAQPTIQMSGTD